jgi:hypothetical protein
MRTKIVLLAPFVLTTILAACGGSTPEAKEPEGTETEAPAAEKAEAEAPGEDMASEDSAESKKEAKKDDAKEEEEAKKPPARSAKDIVTKPDTLYMFQFSASEAYQEADKSCTEKSKDDPKKKADCMSKASKKIDDDGLAFQEVDGKMWWLTIRRKGNALQTLHKIEFEIGEDSENKLVIKLKGPDKGTKPMGNVPSKLEIEVVSESQIALQDPKLGKMVYEAKLGLIGDNKR